MPISRVVTPDVTRLALSGDDWIVVKRRLSAGDMIALFDASADPNHPDRIDRYRAGIALMQTYIVEWSLVDPQGRPIDIAEGADAIKAAVLSIDFDSFSEILTAVREHDRTTREKKRQSAASELEPYSTSLVGVTGGMNG
jgi:hypothetical protein